MQLTENQYSFCLNQLRVLTKSAPSKFKDGKPRMEFSHWGCLICCELYLGDFQLDAFFPEVYA